MSQMFPPDMAAALGAGGGAPAGGGLPPDLAALLGGGAGAGPAGPVQGAGASSDPNAQSSDLIAQAVDLLKQAHDVEPEPEDQAVISQCLNALDKLQAKNQQEADGMLQGKATPKAIRKAAGAQGYGG